MDKFLLVIYKLPKLNQENLNSLYKSLKIKKIEAANFLNSPTKKHLGLGRFTAEFYQTFKGKLTPRLIRCF